MSPNGRTPTIRSLSPFLIAVSLWGCSPKKAEQVDSVSRPAPTATPSTKPFRILAELPASSLENFKSTFDQGLELPGGWHLEWKTFGAYQGPWDLALLSPPAQETLAADSIELGDLLDQIFPLHNADFILSASHFRQEGKLLCAPVLFLPHLLYAKKPELASAAGFESYLEAGNSIALPAGRAGEWYQERLRIESRQVHSMEPASPENPFLTGAVEIAIADRSWIAAQKIPASQVYPLTELGLDDGILDWGIRVSISNRCANPSLAQRMVKAAIVDFQDRLVASGGGFFPVRRSVYQSPRIQGIFLGAPKRVFDTTIERLTAR